MKKITVFIALVFCFQAMAQRKPKIKGNRSVVEVNEDLLPFNTIELNDDLEISLQKSAYEGYTVAADDNLIDVLKFRVEDSVLAISSFYKITSKKKLDITIHYKELGTIIVRDGKLSVKDVVSSDKLYVGAMGAARLEFNATVEIMEIHMEGMSSGDFNIASDSLNITLKDRVDARIYSVGESNTVAMHKNSTAKMEGTAENFHVSLNENSNLKAERLEAAAVKIKLEESSTARIHAYRDFELSSAGSSKTYLYGTPKIFIGEFLDTSQLHKRQD